MIMRKKSKSGKAETRCVHDFVNCFNGYAIDNTTKTCMEACGSSCCVGSKEYPNACEGFTGKICKDGKSCMGLNACSNGTITSVVNGCYGQLACYYGMILKSVVNGCNGTEACANGKIESVVSGCNGENACALAYIESIVNGCNGFLTCTNAGRVGGIVSSIQNSCNGYLACNGVGIGNGGSIGSILKSCNAIKACYVAGGISNYGATGPITSNLKTCCIKPYKCNSVNETTLPKNCGK
jgi:hypothetical protein